MRVFVNGVGLTGPGLESWSQALPMLRGEADYARASLPRLNPAALTGELRRRSDSHIRLAVQVAAEAVAQAQVDAGTLASVFATGEGDMEIAHYICDALTEPTPALSPTRFHNSVTNAAAGYWSMAVGAMAPSTAVSGHDATFAVGLLEACAQALTDGRGVLLVAHDTPAPPPLHAARPLSASFGVALVLSPDPTPRSLAALDVQLGDQAQETPLDPAALEALRTGNPAARALPLLRTLACGEGGHVVLPYVDGVALTLGVTRC